jgi:hypothetical protein
MNFNKTPKPSCEFFFVRELTHSVSAKSWHDGAKWHWNVYAYVQEKHSKFADDEYLQSLPFNGGCTHDSIRITQPTEIKYDWQKRVTTKIVGSDYNHIHDNYDNHPAPFERIPFEVLRDAEALAAELERTK